MLTIRPLNPSDYQEAIQFAIEGMQFDQYLTNRWARQIYGRYFFYEALNQATQVIAAYYNTQLVGLLLARINGEKPVHQSRWQQGIVRSGNWLSRTFFANSSDVYEQTNQQLLQAYQANHHPDGEIIFLAAKPNSRIKGIGTFLLDELTRREKGKEIYLFTDSFCTYQFYEHRGFKRFASKEITLSINKRQIPMTAMLFVKKL